MTRLLWLLPLFATPAAADCDAARAMFDAHIHYNADAHAHLSPPQVLRILREAGIERALVSSTPNAGTEALYRLDPARVVPTLRPYRTDADRRTWFEDPETVRLVERELGRGIYRGIGEFHLSGRDARGEALRQIAERAAQRGLVLHAHADADAITGLFGLRPDVRILWAHAGMNEKPDTVGVLLERHASLWVELSLRGGDVAPGGRLDPRWRELFLRHPKRFLVGTDTWSPGRFGDLPFETAATRHWLCQLPAPVAEQIAHGNARALFRAPARPEP